MQNLCRRYAIHKMQKLHINIEFVLLFEVVRLSCSWYEMLAMSHLFSFWCICIFSTKTFQIITAVQIIASFPIYEFVAMKYLHVWMLYIPEEWCRWNSPLFRPFFNSPFFVYWRFIDEVIKKPIVTNFQNESMPDRCFENKTLIYSLDVKW